MDNLVIMGNTGEVAVQLKKKMEDLKITKEKFLSTYRIINEKELDCMLDGNYKYNDKMDRVASSFLGVKVKCHKEIEFTCSFRKGEGEGEWEKFIKRIVVRFENMIPRKENITDVKYKFKDGKEFLREFTIKRPLSIENFIEMNYTKDNFIVVMEQNKIGISGLATTICKDNIEYKCIYINTGEPLGRQIFTFFHELYHIYFEKSHMHIFKEEEYSDDGHKIESRAHQFASELILNSVELVKILRENNMSNHRNIEYKEVYDIQKKFNATFQAVIYKIEQIEKSLVKHIKMKKLPSDEEELEIKRAIQDIPKIPQSIKIYYNKACWQKLNDKIAAEDPSNILNLPTYETKEYV